MHAAAEADANLKLPFQLTARAENLYRGVNDLGDTIKRLKAFESVGANVLYVPGITSFIQLNTVTVELEAPFNVLAPCVKGASVAELSEVGAARISIGDALNLASVSPILKAGNEMLLQGLFDWISEVAARNSVNEMLTS